MLVELYSHHHLRTRYRSVTILSTCSPRQPLIYFMSVDLPNMDISHKWNHIIIFVFCGWLVLLTRMVSSFIHVSVLHPFWLLRNGLLCGYIAGKGDVLQGLRVDSCLALRSDLSKKTPVRTKPKTLWEGPPWWRAAVWGNARELLCHMVHSLKFYYYRVSFWVVSGQSFWLRVFPGDTHVSQLRYIPAWDLLGNE